jgi:hypothetical protein
MIAAALPTDAGALPVLADGLCACCRVAVATLMDSEHGPVCGGCSDDLADADTARGVSRFAFPILPDPDLKTKKHEHEKQEP